MYALVADLESYPQFLPGCTGSRLLSRIDGEVTASLDLSRGPFAATFTTRNALEPPQRMTMALVDGPFKQLHGEWNFVPMAGAGCRVELEVRFEMASAVRDWLLGPAFEATCGGLVDAFVARAKSRYAVSPSSPPARPS
jgi:ribosome-associated toxin RatA of RatAB toxin-antitoxin module